MSVISSILSGINQGTRAAGRVFSRSAGAFINGLQRTAKLVKRLALNGYNDAAVYTMGAESRARGHRSVSELAAATLLFPVTYLIGFIAAATLAPLVYYGYKNLVNFAKFPSQKLDEYTDIDELYNADELRYNGGPLYIYGLAGAAIGLTIGLSWAVIRIITIKIPYESFRSAQLWFAIGKKIAFADKHRFTNTEDDRRFFSIVFGYIPLGIALSAITFAAIISGVTILRFIQNNIFSIFVNVERGFRFAFFDKPNVIKNPAFKKKRTEYEFFLGMPGFIVGACFGSIIAAGLTAWRIFINSLKNLAKFFSIGLSHPLRDTVLKFTPHQFKLRYDSFQEFISSIKLSYAENILGAPGYLLAPVGYLTGTVLGSIIRVGFETLMSFFNTINALIFQLALRGRKASSGEKFEDLYRYENRKYYEHIIGFIGYPIGFAISAPFVAIIGLVRYGATNIDSGKRVFNHLTSKVFGNDKKLKEDNRPGLVKFLSAPGAILGLIFGGTVRFTAENFYGFVNATKLLIKTSLKLAPNHIAKSGYLIIANRPFHLGDVALRIPGCIAGAIISSPLVAGIVFSRFIITNAVSAKREFALTVNPNLTEKSQIKIEQEDTRALILKRAGYPGAALGKIAGAFGLVSIESAVYFEYIFKRSIITALTDMDEEILDNFETPEIEGRSYFLGAPGALLGAISGGVGFVVTGGGRFIFNTMQTVYHVTLDMVKFVRSKEIPAAGKLAELAWMYNQAEYEPLSQSDSESGDGLNLPSIRRDRRNRVPFYLGAVLGFPIGGIIGLVSATIVGFFRIIEQTMKRSFNESLDYAKFAVKDRDKAEIEKYKFKQAKIDKMLGFLGIWLGVPMGLIGFLALGTKRVIENIATSFVRAVKYVSNLPPFENTNSKDDNRGTTDKILGLPGYILGVAVGIVMYFGRIAFNIVYHSFATAKRDIKNITRWTLGDTDNHLILGFKPSAEEASVRTYFERHVFGFPGHIVGTTIGAVVGTIILGARVSWHNIKSALLAGQFASNYVLDNKLTFANEYRYKKRINSIKIFDKAHKTPHGLKYIMALPGIIVGGIMGAAFVVAPYYFKEFLRNTGLSFIHLSKSLLNVGLEDFYFKGGVKADKRPTRYKIAGVLGYALAPFASGIIIFIHNIPTLCGIAIAIISSPLVGIYKIYRMAFHPRFPDNTSAGVDVTKMQRIKNLNSALVNGEIDTKKISASASGGKGSVDFITKLFAFNTHSPAEKVLDAHLNNLINPNDKLTQEISSIQENIEGIAYTGDVKRRRTRAMQQKFDADVKSINIYIENGQIDFFAQQTTKGPSWSELFNHTEEDYPVEHNRV